MNLRRLINLLSKLIEIYYFLNYINLKLFPMLQMSLKVAVALVSGIKYSDNGTFGSPRSVTNTKLKQCVGAFLT